MFVVNSSLGYLLGQAAKRTSSRFAQLLQEHGMDFGLSGWIILSRLWEEDGLSQQQISERSNVAKPNISNYADALEQSNYIVRVPDPNDRRNQRLFLTARAKSLKQQCYSLAEQANRETLMSLTEQEAELFQRLLTKIVG